MGLARRAFDWFVYGALRGAMALLGLVPPDASTRLARATGRLYMRIDRPRALTVRENLRVALADRVPEEERARLAVRVFEHFFLLAFEVIGRPRLFPNARAYARRSHFVGDVAAMLADARAGRTPVVFSGHLGNWEFLGASARAVGLPISAVARPIDNPHVNEWLGERRGGPEILIYKRGAVRSVVDALGRGRWVAVLGDQNAGRNGVFLPFFGVPASTFPLGASIAVRAGVPVYFAAALRLGNGFRYEVRVLRYDGSAFAHAPSAERVRRLLEAYTAQLEAWVREFPDQYFWLHRRWRTRPKGEAPGPHLPRYPSRRRRVASSGE